MQRDLLLLAEAVTRAPIELLLVLSDLKRKRWREGGREGGRERGRKGRGKKRRGQADVPPFPTPLLSPFPPHKHANVHTH
jgi:hypothetical protein